MNKYCVIPVSIIIVTSVSSAWASEESRPSAKVAGYVDAQYQAGSGGSTQWVNKPTQASGFLINDGEIQVLGQMGSTEARFDLPFRYSGAGDNSFSFAKVKAQAYVLQKFGDTWSARMGQFDTPFGFETNDTPEIAFTSQGRVFATNPLTHTGLMISGKSGSGSVNLIVANPRDSGSMDPDPALGTRRPELGIQLGFNPSDLFRINAGGLTTRVGNSSRTYVDTVIGTTLGRFVADAEANYTKLNDRDPAMGQLANVMFNFDEELSAGLRGEHLTKSLGQDAEWQMSVGPQFRTSKSVRYKIDYTLSSVRAAPELGFRPSHGGAFAAVFVF